MSGERGYASVPERITWTTGFHNGTDKTVLGALSTFANFETGKGARVRVNKLAARAELEPRTVQRSLHRLEAGGWIVAVRRQNKRATAWDINISRLATTWVVMKAAGGVMSSFPQADTFSNDKTDVRSNDHFDVRSNDSFDVRDAFSNDKNDVRDLILERQNCRADPLYVPDQIPRDVPIPSAPALRAGSRDAGDETPEEALPPWEEFNRAVQSQARNADVRADGDDDSDHAAGDPGGRRGDHQLAPAAGVPLRQGPDSPGTESDQRPRPPVEPTQQTFGPIDVSPRPARPAPQWGQLADALRKGLKRKSG
jgi:hypothetical protein